MTPSKNCLDLIKRFEGFSAKPYLCPAGIPTIGYGSTYYTDGSKVTLKDYRINEHDANTMLELIAQRVGHEVMQLLKVPVNQNQFDALVSFAYNLGASKLASSTLLRKLNAKDYAGASQQFGRWVYQGEKRLSGLVNRRNAEKQLFEG